VQLDVRMFVSFGDYRLPTPSESDYPQRMGPRRNAEVVIVDPPVSFFATCGSFPSVTGRPDNAEMICSRKVSIRNMEDETKRAPSGRLVGD
jgi:hypothetical protein